jgi:hypothetical protein
MLFRRIAFVGILLAAIAGSVLQIRLMKGAALREIHLLVGQQTKLQHQIARQDLELAQLRAPWRVADRLSSIGMDILPPAANRASVEPKKPGAAEAAGTSAQPDPTEPQTQPTHPGGAAKQWPSHPAHNSPKKTSH